MPDPGPPLPPSTASLGMRRNRWEAGHTGLVWPVPHEVRLTNTAGHLHGGYLCVMADALLGSALSSTAGDGQVAVTLEVSAHFLERVQLGDELAGEGRVVRRGRRIGFLDATIRDTATGRLVLVAQGTGTFRHDGAHGVKHPPTERLASADTPEGEGAAPLAEAETPHFVLPPWLPDFGVRYESPGDGRARLTWPIAPERFDNRAGLVQGGFLCHVADAAMGFALIEGVADARAMATTTLSLQLLHPVRSGSVLVVDAWVERRGRRFGFMACEIRHGEQIVARGRASGLLRF